MGEKRARDIEVGDKIREIGFLDDDFMEVVSAEMRGDDVLLDVVEPGEVRPRSIPVLDGDEVVEVED